jgi:hypothetical protein
MKFFLSGKMLALALVGVVVAALLSYGNASRDCSTAAHYDSYNGKYISAADCEQNKTQARFWLGLEGGAALGIVIATVARRKGWYEREHLGRPNAESTDG